jgi:flagellin-like protein
MEVTNMFKTLKTQYTIARMTVDQYAAKFMNDNKAETPIRALIMLVVIAVLAGALIPVGINALTAGKNASWTASEIALYGIISIMVLVAVVMLLVRIATE